MQTGSGQATGEGCRGKHALIIGGSMASLLAARVLSDYFAGVTILERDTVNDAPEARKGQPQARHLHALLAQGLRVMEHYFPDLVEGLQAHGAQLVDMGTGMRWHICGGYRLQAPTGLMGVLMSRPLLEWQVRRRVLALPNVRLIDGCSVAGLVFDSDKRRVIGVQAARRTVTGGDQTYLADLVVDACGRGAPTPRWLHEAGYAPPAESAVRINTGYATRVYRRSPGDLPGAALIIVSAEGPHQKRSGLVFPIEDDRWIVSLGGINGDHPPLDDAGFLAFARSLNAPDINNLLVKLEPLSPITPHKFPASLRRHYEKLEHFPAGYLVLGDALCSFNPVYGQGITCAALQAQALDGLLGGRDGNLDHLAHAFFARAAKIVDIPWQMAAGADFLFPDTEGEKPTGLDAINAYMGRVHRATHHDPVVLKEFLKVMNLMQSPASLFHPKVLLRVLGPDGQGEPAHAPVAAVEMSG